MNIETKKKILDDYCSYMSDGQFYDNGKNKEYQREKINLNGLVGRNDFVTIPQNCDIEKLNSIIDKVVSIINNRNERLRHS